MGVAIFERMRGSVRLTKAGADIVDKAELAKQAAQDIKAIAKAHSDPFAGELALGVIPTIGPFLLPYFSKLLVDTFPKLRLAYIEDTTDRLTEQLLSGDLDAAILATLPMDDALICTLLYDERFHIAMPKVHDL
ncbi:MAG: hypothetical protein JKX72_07075 [Robiginitomaculum sp.]|nr:hypothetical protein [Robiginitomaculum sp.]